MAGGGFLTAFANRRYSCDPARAVL
ncbi:hypothetical protein MTBSS4_10124 [Magnetospirillum sp. SS-4]|nr:hypothetical protein MTBSS4_10124 [Magnetospirillum sp. SS-4]